MNFPRYWAKASHQGFSCWRWSNSSQAEALALAQESARRIAARFASGEELRHGYGYPDRPLREPVLVEIKSAGGDIAAVITRNSYGALVLNSPRVMFVDVDLPEPASSGGWFRKLFSKTEPPEDRTEEEAVVARAAEWARAHAGWGWRIYRTRSGLRLMATHALLDADTPSTEQVFEALGADPLYRRLCKTQNCFRARLTPKPWRCNVRNPPGRWPWPHAKAEERFKKWEDRYQRSCREFATCRLLSVVGGHYVDPTAQLIVEAHDRATSPDSNLPLA